MRHSASDDDDEMKVGRTFVLPQRIFANCIPSKFRGFVVHAAYPRAAAPLFFCTCLHVFRRLATRLLATLLLFCCATTMRTLDLSQALSTEGRFASWLTATCQFCPTDFCQLHPVEISLICLTRSLPARSGALVLLYVLAKRKKSSWFRQRATALPDLRTRTRRSFSLTTQRT